MNYTERFARMTEQEMRNALAQRKSKLPEPVINDIVANVKADREALRPMLKKREQHTRLWKQIIDPAVYELRNVRRMLKLKLSYPTPERTAALEAYAEVIELVIGKLQLHIDKLNVHEDRIDDDPLTPSQQASKATKAFPNGKPNGGTYWTDYVPYVVVKKISALFKAVPKEAHVKRKHPFPVVLDKATSAKRREILIERTTKELTHIERIIAVELADPRLKPTHFFKHQEIGKMRLQASQMQSALHIISLLPPNAFIPATWHGVMTERTQPGRQPLPKGKTK
tara:strand:- start:63 stop:911 length:849 start_codon:yes stop_codon:yes gene_type:complete